MRKHQPGITSGGCTHAEWRTEFRRPIGGVLLKVREGGYESRRVARIHIMLQNDTILVTDPTASRTFPESQHLRVCD